MTATILPGEPLTAADHVSLAERYSAHITISRCPW